MSEKPLFEDIKQELIAQNREPEEIEQIEKAYLFAKRLMRVKAPIICPLRKIS